MILGAKLGVGLGPEDLNLGLHLDLFFSVSAWNYYPVYVYHTPKYTGKDSENS